MHAGSVQAPSQKACAWGAADRHTPGTMAALKGLFVPHNVLFYHSKPVTAAIIQIPIHFMESTVPRASKDHQGLFKNIFV